MKLGSPIARIAGIASGALLFAGAVSGTALASPGAADVSASFPDPCTSVDAASSHDISNVVLEFADGTRQRFEDLSGHAGTFAGTGEHDGKVVVVAWVKSGSNHSGDGPGYGDRFDSDCATTTTVESTSQPGDGPADGDTAPGSADVSVGFDCTSVEVTSSRDISNVVLEFADGTRQRFEDLSGHAGTFAGIGEHDGKVVVVAWVKSGSNHSGDGPGYGERFDSDATCEVDLLADETSDDPAEDVETSGDPDTSDDVETTEDAAATGGDAGDDASASDADGTTGADTEADTESGTEDGNVAAATAIQSQPDHDDSQVLGVRVENSSEDTEVRGAGDEIVAAGVGERTAVLSGTLPRTGASLGWLALLALVALAAGGAAVGTTRARV